MKSSAKLNKVKNTTVSQFPPKTLPMELPTGTL